MAPMRIDTPKQMITKFKTLTSSMPTLDSSAMKALQKICRGNINYFKAFGDFEMTPNGPYIYQDNGADVLAIGHLDTVQKAHHFSVTNLSHDKRIHCPTLDDRLGVFVITYLLPKMDIVPDILLTTGEEQMQSSALYFKPPPGKKYNWMFSFDRAGTDCVLYDYWDWEMNTLLERAGWKTGHGSYSDISELEHLRIKGINFGVGYQEYHSLDAWASVKDLYENLKKFERFFKANADVHLKHTPRYNMWTPEDGFAYVYKPGSIPYQDRFTDAEIELLESLDFEGVNLGKTRITPYDLRLEVNEALGKAPTDFPEPIQEPSLFDDLKKVDKVSKSAKETKQTKESESSKEQTSGPKRIRVKAGISLSSAPQEETRSVVPSEDDPMGSLTRTRKSVASATIIHSEGDDLDKAEKLKEVAESEGKETLGPLIKVKMKCEVCGDEDGNPCHHCITESEIRRQQEIDAAKERLKMESQRESSESDANLLRVVANVPLAGKEKEKDDELEYKQNGLGGWEWTKKRRIKAEEAVF